MIIPRVSVIIVTYNGQDFIKKCLESLEKQEYPKNKYEIIVIDNNSSDNTLKIMRDFHNVSIIQNCKNVGFGSANNIGFKKCHEADYVILLNQDSIVENNFITQLVNVMETNSEIGVCGGAEHPYNTTLKSNRKTEETNWIGGGAIILRMVALQQVGFFDPHYFMYSEDIDLCLRLRCAGWKVYYHPKAIWHHHGWKRKVDFSDFRVLHSSVSRIYLLVKFCTLLQIMQSSISYLQTKKEVKSSQSNKKNSGEKERKKNKLLMVFKILLLILPKLPFAIINRLKVRQLPYFNQRMINNLIKETDEQIYGGKYSCFKKKMRKILYISLTEQVSGGEISVLQYINSLDKTVYTPILLCPKDGTLSEHARKNNIRVSIHRMSRLSKKNPWKYLQDILWLILLIKKEQIDILHGMSFYTCQLAGPAGYFAGIPVLIHGQNMLSSRKDIYVNFLFTSSRIIVCSRAVGDCLLPTIHKNKIFLLHHSVPTPQKPSKKTFFIHAELGIQKNTTLIAHIGTLEERKCQDILIRAAKRIFEKYTNVVFLIIGDSLFNTENYKNMLYKLREHFGLQKKVLFLGWRKDIHALLPELDVVVLPSYNEPLAMVTLEAGSYGKPYIGAYTGGTSEIIKHKENGLLVQPKNVDELYDALCFIFDNPKKAQNMGVRMKKTIQKECNIAKNSKILCELYTSLLKKHY